MISKALIDAVATRMKIKNRDMLEKDLILHRLLIELMDLPEFAENYAFKGGTCLMKCYFGYYRFSEDLDFTYINQKEFDKKTETQIRKEISKKISSVAEIIKKISDKIGLNFMPEKTNVRYFEYGGGNKFTTMKLWYTPEGSNEETYIKIQINFVDKLFYPLENCSADNIFFGDDKLSEIAFLLPQDSEWVLKIPNTKCYDLREILTEKIRAILTRKGVKGRDFIDLFLIYKHNKFNPKDYKREILEKTKYMVEKYGKYADNIKTKEFSYLDRFALGEEERLLIKKIPEGFDKFLAELKPFLEELLKSLKK